MKKFLTLAAFFAAVAMASYGGNTLLAHAQTATATVTPTNTAALQQQLDDAKAELVQLQMQAGEIPVGDAGAPTQPVAVVTPSAPAVTLSAADVSEMSSALTALANLLETVQTKAAQDPQFISSDGPVVVSALQDISQTIATIGTEMNGSNVAMATPAPSAPVAVSAPTTGGTAALNPTSIAQSAPSAAATSPVTPTAPTAVNTAPTTAPLSTVPPQVAQASSAFSFSKLNWPLIIVIVLIVAAIAIWLWWDDGDEKKQPVVKTVTTVPQRPTQQAQPMPLQVNNQVTVNSTSQGQNGNRQPSAAPQTPLSSAVAPHANR